MKSSIHIITPSFNSGTFLKQCLESVIFDNANYELHHHVIDNCSTDSTFSVLSDHRSKGCIFHFSSEKDKGPASAVNKGFKTALSLGAEIIGWLNADDYYHPDAIARVVKIFEENPKIDIVYGQGCHVNFQGEVLDPYPSSPPETGLKGFLKSCFICQPTVFFRAEVFYQVGFLDESLKTAFDFDLWIRVFNKYKKSQIYFINKVLAYSRLHDQCLTNRLRETVFLESMQVLKKYFGHSPIHWLLTYLNEIFQKFPFIESKNSLVSLVKEFLSKSKVLIEPTQFQKAIKTLEKDCRLRFSSDQFCLQIEPDGWVSKNLFVKLRYDESQKHTLLLQCQGGWDSAENLYLTIYADDGSIEKVKLNTQDKFVLTLEAPKTKSLAYASWRIETRQFFVPSQVHKRSKDHRALSFRVDAVSLQ